MPPAKHKPTTDFLSTLARATTEEEVKFAYARHFDLVFKTSDHIDLYTPQILFEFKKDKNFKSPPALAHILAQSLYYIHELKHGWRVTDKPIPPFICLADKNEATICETTLWQPFYDNPAYDWDLAPSNPDKLLVDAIAASPLLQQLHIYDLPVPASLALFSEQLTRAISGQIEIRLRDKKRITERNFEEVFAYWNNIFGDSVRNGFKTSRYFVSDIQQDNTIFLPDKSRAIFRVGQTGELKEKKILPKDYEHFWSIYEKVGDMDVIRAILAKIDRLTDETMRRFHGEFFTPLKFANKALDYINKVIPQNAGAGATANFWSTGQYRLWDMAAGTGNLEYHLPQEALQYCYLSTLYKEDIEHLEKLFTTATIFQYDYLNDDIGNVFADAGGLPLDITWKLPKKLRDDLANPELKWIILINPPFATAQKTGTIKKDAEAQGVDKKGVSETAVRKIMHKAGLGEVSRELFSQFLFRIKQEFKDKTAHLGLFSTLKYINANNDQKFRDSVFHYIFERGFVFSSANFDGTKKNNPFPVGFLLWNMSQSQRLETQDITLDVFNDRVEKTGTKSIVAGHKSEFLSKWIERPAATITFPPFSSAVDVAADNKDRRDRIAAGFLASLMCKGNDMQNQNFTALFSAPYVSAGALSVTPDNFEKAMVIHAARRIPKATWLNDRDQFLQPNRELPADFITNCAVWNLFSGSNNTAALRNIAYEGQTYQIRNHFFPFPVSEVRDWTIADNDIALQLSTAANTYVADWLRARRLTPQATAVLDAARALYKLYFASLGQLRTAKFKIETWDAGWWQIRMSLNDANLGAAEFETLKTAHNALKAEILPALKHYGILSPNW